MTVQPHRPRQDDQNSPTGNRPVPPPAQGAPDPAAVVEDVDTLDADQRNPLAPPVNTEAGA